MERYLLKIAYNGTNYHGWQVQPNGITVQEKMQDAFLTVFNCRPDITGCSRTDAGVHAKEFYCHFDFDSVVPLNAFVQGLNSALPNDIRVLDCRKVANNFHCRYNALGKNYIYKLNTSKVFSPFYSDFSLHYTYPINAQLINGFCKEICGTHDFAAFSSINRSVTDTIRTVQEFTFKLEDDFAEFSITANGFLYNMVRIIVGTALAVNENKILLSQINDIFASKDRTMAGKTVQPQGLFLNKVIY